MRVSLGAPTPINTFDKNAAAIIYQSKPVDGKPSLLLGRLHNTVSSEKFPLDLEDNFTDADVSEIDLEGLYNEVDGDEGDDDVGEEAMLADDFLLPEECSVDSEEDIDDDDLPLLVLQQKRRGAHAAPAVVAAPMEASQQDEAALMFASLL